jgi:8-hydroxy-5-deazaflavin:NADPH oxidoreductase
VPASPADPVAVLGGSGAFGFGIAIRLAQTGVPIVIGSRERSRAEQTAKRARELIPDGTFTGQENTTAVDGVATIILSVPFRNHSETLTNLKSTLHPGQLLIDTTVPLAAAVSGKATRMLGVWQGSAAQQTAEMTPDGVSVVSALHTVSAASLTDLEHPLQQDVLLCGDERAEKQRAANIIQRIEGLRCIDCGALEMARTTEALTALLISVNVRYKAHAGIKLTGLPEQLWQ